MGNFYDKGLEVMGWDLALRGMSKFISKNEFKISKNI